MPNFTTLYHITHKDNLSSIREHGIIPKYKNGIGKESIHKVFLTDNPSYIMNTQCTESEIPDKVVLTIDCSELNIDPHIVKPTGEDHVCPHEYVCDFIEPHRIIG